MLGEPATVTHINYRPVVDIASLLTASSVGAVVGAAVSGLIARGTARSSSRTEREDEYRREVRSAASSIVGAARSFIDATNAFERSISWVKDAVRTTSGHDERYLAYQEAKVELEEKIANFELLVDIDILSKSALAIIVHALLIELSIPVIITPELSNYTETKLRIALKDIRDQIETLEKADLPNFRKSVNKHMPPTIVEEKRRRKRILRAVTVSWHRLML